MNCRMLNNESKFISVKNLIKYHYEKTHFHFNACSVSFQL